MGQLRTRIGSWLARNRTALGISFTILELVGFGASLYLTAKAAPEAAEAKKKAEEEKGEPLTFIETVKVEAPYYGRAAVASAATLGLMVGSEVANQNRIRTLESACTALIAANTRFERVIDYPREDDEEDVPPWDGPQIFYLSFCEYPEFFECDEAKIYQAELEMNRRFQLHKWVNPYDFPKLLGLGRSCYGEGDDIFYDYCRDEAFRDVCWIDFIHHKTVNDDGLIVNSIDMIFRKKPDRVVREINSDLYEQ